MVRVHMLLPKGKESFCQVWYRDNRDVVLDDIGVYPRSTIREARVPVWAPE